MPATFTGGAEYSYDDLRDEMLGYNRIIAQTVHIGSVFAQNEWKNDKWSFLIGGRLDKHNLMDHVIFSPRANLRFNPTKDINLRLSYSSGFRAPQAFDEDLHITAVGGEASIIQLSPDLKEENSRSVSASVDFYHRFGPVQVNLLAERGLLHRLAGRVHPERGGARRGRQPAHGAAQRQGRPRDGRQP